MCMCVCVSEMPAVASKLMAVGQDQEKHFDFVRSHLTTLASIFNNSQLIKSLCFEKGIITLDEYNSLVRL